MECNELDNYSAVARAHAIHPRNYGPMSAFDGHARITGPCGDTMEFWLTIHDGKLIEVTFITDGCGTSRACGSMTTCLAEGRSPEDVIDLQPRTVLEAFGGFPAESEHCALLAVTTLKAACESYLARRRDGSTEPKDAEQMRSGYGEGNPKTDRTIESDSRIIKKEGVQFMKIAIPLVDGKLSAHFGHCEHFALIDIDTVERKILVRKDVDAPPHQPGLLPPWLAEHGANMILAGGMGQRAQQLFAQQGIRVVIGVPSETPERLVTAYLAGTLQIGENICDH